MVVSVDDLSDLLLLEPGNQLAGSKRRAAVDQQPVHQVRGNRVERAAEDGSRQLDADDGIMGACFEHGVLN